VLKWLGGGKVDHPMADEKQARQIVAELPANDSAKALLEITEWLESLNQTEGFKADRRFENLDLLDGAARTHQRKLSQEYLSTSRQQKFQENKLWNALSGFWKALGDGYILCIESHGSGAGGAAAVRKILPVIVARALRVLTLQLKWVLLRYGPVEPRLWGQLGRLYQFAEERGFADVKVAVYTGADGESTVKNEFLKALMLAASSTDGLPPMRQQITERVVAHFAPGFRLSRAVDGCSYCFDLIGEKPPVRLFRGAVANPYRVFFGAGESLMQLSKVATQFVETGGVPKDLNLGGSYGKDEILGTFKYLLVYWSEQAPARGSQRRKSASRITVVPGLTEILDVLAPAESDALDFIHINRSAESWVVENESDSGYGAVIAALKADWVKVGTLIGIQPEGRNYWSVGMVRRISRDDQQQRRVGIQLLSKAAIPIKLTRLGTITTFNAGREPGGAILLSTAPDNNGEVGVVMREGIFNERDNMEMIVRQKSYTLVPSQMVEGGEDFDWAKFKVKARFA
jgi:hypothetical protein